VATSKASKSGIIDYRVTFVLFEDVDKGLAIIVFHLEDQSLAQGDGAYQDSVGTAFAEHIV